jgi:3-phosphoshikimate 1-carboxyvinyltransferase
MMRLVVTPGGKIDGDPTVPGDKSIAHRWLILAATARGGSSLADLPGSLDVRSTAACLAAIAPAARPALEVWTWNGPSGVEGGGSTWNDPEEEMVGSPLQVEGEGRDGLEEPATALDCGNSGTSMRLLTGVLASTSFRSRLVGDASLSARPMERVAEPLRAMGADVTTTNGHAPVTVRGRPLTGADVRLAVPTAQVKGSVLFAAVAAEGATTVQEPATTRDHTERALRALGGPIEIGERTVRISPFRYEGFSGRVPGDVSSAAFLVAAAALTASDLTVRGVGLNPSRLRFLDVFSRMGVRTAVEVEAEELGEPVGALHVHGGVDLRPVEVRADELPLVHDEVPVLALVAAHAPGESRFSGAAELRVKESDRLAAVADGIEALGGGAAVERDDLVVAGDGLRGGHADAAADHRIAMALTVSALAARGPSRIDGVEVAAVSYPGFVRAIRRLGATVEVEG